MKPGQTVKFLAPLSIAESGDRFTILELRGNRMLVELVCTMSFKPTFVYLTSELEVA